MLTQQRKRAETILLAALAIYSVTPLRYPVESRAWFIAEFVVLFGLFVVAEVAKTFGMTRSKLLASSATALLAIMPIVFAFLTRFAGSPVAFEMSALSTFGATSLALAIGATTSRTRAMSLVASGFLVLFTTSISDSPSAVIVAIAWMTICVWHLVANHWEKLDLCMPDTVRPTIGVKPMSVLIAVTLCVVGGLIARDRFGESTRFTVGLMPSSGGSKWSDPAARSGVGTGEAAIAAKDHAESFGAVESDIFLESTESTLFDMFNDSLGELKKKNKSERRQGLANQTVIPTHEHVAKSEKGGGSFSTDRMPPKKHHHFDDATGPAVIQWDGPTGIRLAMERFDTFDGVNWTNQANHRVEPLSRFEQAKHIWFFDPKTQSRAFENGDAISVNLLKVLRLDSTRLPVPMMTSGVHVKDVDRQDFFSIDEDGSFFMPGREKVPPMTVVNVASLSVMEDELINLTGDRGSRRANLGSAGASPSHGIAFDNDATPYEQLQSLVSQLRTEFTFDRQVEFASDDPVNEFLQTRRGGDHLFATTAALLAREIGLESRLVTGFYVRPDAFEIAAGHASILPEDVHVWAEIKLDDNRWFEIEPTPGYREPVYTPSMWLVAKRFAAANWLFALAGFAVVAVMFLTRLIWIEWILVGMWAMTRFMRPKSQLTIAMRIIETRARLTGRRRPVGKPQRDWMESLAASNDELSRGVARFCDVADLAIFGQSAHLDRASLDGLVQSMTTSTFQQLNKDAIV